MIRAMVGAGAGAQQTIGGGHHTMHRPALPRTRATAHPRHTAGWAHPYPAHVFSPVLYADGGAGGGGGAGAPSPDPAPAPAPVGQPKPTPPTERTFTQAELNEIATREKAQGGRAALKKFAEDNGFNSVEDAKAFIETARQAHQAQLTEQERRDQELAAREAALAQREAAAAAAQRAAERRAILVGLGAVGDNLEDAALLLRVDDDADQAAITTAAENLKTRRPELFGATAPPTPTTPPAPGGAPAGGPPPRQQPSGKPGDRGRAMAAARGHRKPAA